MNSKHVYAYQHINISRIGHISAGILYVSYRENWYQKFKNCEVFMQFQYFSSSIMYISVSVSSISMPHNIEIENPEIRTDPALGHTIMELWLDLPTKLTNVDHVTRCFTILPNLNSAY